MPTSEFTVSVADDMSNGKLLLLDDKGNSVNKGASVASGKVLTVIAVPDKGYQLSSAGIKVGDTSISGNQYKVSANTTFTATFEAITWSNITEAINGVTYTIKSIGTNDTESDFSFAKIGDKLKVTAALNEEKAQTHRLLSLLVNGKEIPNGSIFTVTEEPEITAKVVEKAEIKFNDLTQTVTYDGQGKQFIVRSIPAGLKGFKVAYAGVAEGELPVDADNNTEKSYTVTITRATDSLYKAVNQSATLIIKASEAKYNSPKWINSAWVGAAGTYEDAGATDETYFRNVTFTPSNKNHQKVKYNLARSTEGLTQVPLNNAGLRAAALRADASLSITATNGGVTLWNGTEKLTASSVVYVGQTLTVRGVPNSGYSTKATWTINGTTTTAESAMITLQETNRIEVSFAQKDKPELPTLSSSMNATYSGSPIQPIVNTPDGITGWNIILKAGALIVDDPIDAGSYDVYVTRNEDDVYAAVNEKIGVFTIAKQQINALSAPSASPILKGQTLAQSTLTGTAPVAGTFAWASPTTVPDNETTNYDVTFTPNDTKNYEVASSVSLKQKVTFYTGSTAAAARVITFAPAANGTFVVKVNGVAVETGAQVSAGDQVVVETTPNSGYSASVSYTGITNGVVDAAGNVTVTVTFTRNSAPVTPGGGGTVDPEPEIPTVSNPVVAERTATTAAVTWEKVSGATSYKLFLYAKKTDSTPLKTYEFDKDGKLKATAISFTLTGLEEGKAYYVETAAYNASGTLLVKKSVELSATPTGIEAISEGSQLYTVKGAIVVAPAEPLQVAIYSVTGQTLFNDEVSYLTQIPAKAGIYVVVIQKGNERITEKVFVK